MFVSIYLCFSLFYWQQMLSKKLPIEAFLLPILAFYQPILVFFNFFKKLNIEKAINIFCFLKYKFWPSGFMKLTPGHYLLLVLLPWQSDLPSSNSQWRFPTHRPGPAPSLSGGTCALCAHAPDAPALGAPLRPGFRPKILWRSRGLGRDCRWRKRLWPSCSCLPAVRYFKMLLLICVICFNFLQSIIVKQVDLCSDMYSGDLKSDHLKSGNI